MSTRPSIFPTSTSSSTSSSNPHSTTNRARQYSHLHAQLAQLNAHLADTENLLRMTAVQAEYMRGLGGFCGGLFMAGAKVLGEETGAGRGLVGEAERLAGEGGVERGEGEGQGAYGGNGMEGPFEMALRAEIEGERRKGLGGDGSGDGE